MLFIFGLKEFDVLKIILFLEESRMLDLLLIRVIRLGFCILIKLKFFFIVGMFGILILNLINFRFVVSVLGGGFYVKVFSCIRVWLLEIINGVVNMFFIN